MLEMRNFKLFLWIWDLLIFYIINYVINVLMKTEKKQILKDT